MIIITLNSVSVNISSIPLMPFGWSLMSNVWTWLKLCAQAENCQHYSQWGGYSSQEIGLTWLDLSGINEACLIDKEERGSLEGCAQKIFSTTDWNPIWRSILTLMHLRFQYFYLYQRLSDYFSWKSWSLNQNDKHVFFWLKSSFLSEVYKEH